MAETTVTPAETIHETSRRGTARKPRVTLKCPANAHSGMRERIIEFSFPGLGHPTGVPGGLISFRDRGPGELPRVEVYRTDDLVEVVAPRRHYWAAYAGSATGSQITLHDTYPAAVQWVYDSLGLAEHYPDDPQKPEPSIDDLQERIQEYCDTHADDYEIERVVTP